MASMTRISLASNAKQTNKTIVLLPSNTPDVRAHLFSIATQKLRIKKPSRILLSGGRELHSQTDFQSVLKNDITLLISSGEDYVGNITYTEHSAPTSTQPEIRVLATATPIESEAVKQLRLAAEQLPGIL